MLQNVVLHDKVVLMGVDADVRIMRKAEVHDAAEDSVNIRIAGYTMYYMIRKGIICPLTIIYLRVGWLRGWQECEIADNTPFILNDKAAVLFHIVEDDLLRRVAIAPLVYVARLSHNSLCSLHHLHNIGDVC